MDLRYNIFKKSFNPETFEFGPSEAVLRADTLRSYVAQSNSADETIAPGSAVLPRISPDGRFLLFTLASYGYFHIWHHDADLWLMDLQSGAVRRLDEVNSDDTESYHSWSSNGRWIVFSSRRDDGSFTRPFFAHVGPDGRCGKPFELPTADPNYHRQFLRCYNIPEFMRGPVTITPQTFAKILKGEAEPVTYVGKPRP
jgi:dipeptidyl aminopeptidase/acylaminoacyl peptidase